MNALARAVCDFCTAWSVFLSLSFLRRNRQSRERRHQWWRGSNTSFGTRGSQVQILPLRPILSSSRKGCPDSFPDRLEPQWQTASFIKDALANLWHDASDDSSLSRRCVSSDGAINEVRSGSPSPAAERMRQYRERHRKGLRCVRIQLDATEIDVLFAMFRTSADEMTGV
jgi:hypothetical protein